MKTILNTIQTRLMSMLTVVLFLAVSPAYAQEGDFKPYAFIGLQGGAQTTFTDYNNWKLITPTASVSVGVQFTPIIGARIHANGFWNKGGFKGNGIDATYKYNYATTNMDLMINMVNLITQRNYSPVNLYLIGGVGLNYAWDFEDVSDLKRYISMSDSRNHQSHNFRVGTMLDVNVARHWSVNLEVSANSLSDRYNAKRSGCDDWQLTAQIGVAYKFGIRQKVKSSKRDSEPPVGNPDTDAIDSEPLSANTNVEISKPEPKPEPKTEPKPEPVVVPQTISRNIFFTLRSSEIAAKEQTKLAEVATWLKEHPKAKVAVTGYADKGTGNATINARYAKQRAESVKNELIKKYNIEASRITTDSKGDTVQPFPSDNDQNRVTIVVAEE